MKIVLLIGEGFNQKALACKVHAQFPIHKIILESNRFKRKLTFKNLTKKILNRLFTAEVDNAWKELQMYYQRKFNDFPKNPIVKTDSINSQEIFEIIEAEMPDLIIVSGTSLIKEKILSLKPSIGIINLHTGLSPYIKGGPNCTNWCLATNQVYYIGNTIMWIDKGIDTGNIISTELTNFSGEENLLEIHIKVMEHAHDLYIRSICSILDGKRNNIPQNSLALGKTYYSKTWSFKQRLNLLRNLKHFKSTVQSSSYREKQLKINTVKLE